MRSPEKERVTIYDTDEIEKSAILLCTICSNRCMKIYETRPSPAFWKFYALKFVNIFFGGGGGSILKKK